MRLSLRNTEDIRDHILTVVLVFIAFVLLIVRHEGGLQSVRTASVLAMSYVEIPLSQVRVYRTALQTNEDLGRQNILLLDEISRLRSVQEENRALRSMLDLREEYEHDLIPARIIAKSLSGINNSLTINRGHAHGVEEGMAFITSEGLVGRIILTASGHSMIMPFFNPLFRVSANVQGSRAYGIVSWSTQRPGELVMNYIPQTIAIRSGSVVETSGYGDRFPAFIPIGVVTDTESLPGRDTQQIFIRPFVNLHLIAEGFVVDYEPDDDVDELLRLYEEILQ